MQKSCRLVLGNEKTGWLKLCSTRIWQRHLEFIQQKLCGNLSEAHDNHKHQTILPENLIFSILPILPPSNTIKKQGKTCGFKRICQGLKSHQWFTGNFVRFIWMKHLVDSGQSGSQCEVSRAYRGSKCGVGTCQSLSLVGQAATRKRWLPRAFSAVRVWSCSTDFDNFLRRTCQMKWMHWCIGVDFLLGLFDHW